jgi:phenylalanyl-tRNA synthetase alpha chain
MPLPNDQGFQAIQTGESVEELKAAAVASLDSADSSELLESWRVGFMGRKGRLTALLRGLGSLDIEERKIAGASANKLRSELERFSKNV